MVYDSVYEANNYLRSGVNISKDTTKDGTNSNITLDTTNEKLGTGCYDFNGSTSRSVTSVKFNGLHDNTGGSISFWMRPRNMSSIHGNGDIIFDSMATSAANGTGISIAIKNTSLLRVNFTTSSNQWFTDINSTTQFANNTWYHVVMTFGSNTVKLYINGSQEDTATFSNPNTNASNGNFVIGSHSTDPSSYGYYDGLLDDTGIWNRVITSSEVTSLYNSGTGALSSSISTTDFAGYYNYDAVTGGKLENETTTSYPDARKQHFWDWFSGSKLQEGVTGTNSYSTSFPNATGWGSRGSQVSITGGVVDTDFGTSDDNSAVLRSLGYNISGDFELRFKHRFISYTSSTAGMIALADTTDPVYNPSTAGSNSVMVGVNSDSSGQHSFAFYSVENGVFTNHGDPPISTGKTGAVSNGTDYWLKMTKVGNLVTINVYNNSSYSGTPVTSCYGSVSSSFPSTLNSIQIGMSWTMSGRGAHWTDTDLSLTSDVVGGIRWNTTFNGNGTTAMSDSIDGGLLLTSASNASGAYMINFNNKRQYEEEGSVCIFVGKRTTTTNAQMLGGFISDTALTADTIAVKDYTGNTYKQLVYQKNGSWGTAVNTTVAIDTNWHTHKIELTSSSGTLSIDGLTAVTNSSDHLPDSALQPFFYSGETSGASASIVSQIRYMEAYNT